MEAQTDGPSPQQPEIQKTPLEKSEQRRREAGGRAGPRRRKEKGKRQRAAGKAEAGGRSQIQMSELKPIVETGEVIDPFLILAQTRCEWRRCGRR